MKISCSFDPEIRWNLPFIVGVDEAGRGCLAGPVVAAAVLFDEKTRHELSGEICDAELKIINDSKKMKAEIRKKLSVYIQSKARAFGIGMVDAAEIDRINVLNATFKAARLAIHQVEQKIARSVDLVLMDGNHVISGLKRKQQAVIKGDGISKSIAAASILAKAFRDEWMDAQNERFPHYKWDVNKGYGTEAHREAIQAHGSCHLHRMSFLNTSFKKDFGKDGEERAVEFLKDQNFKILETNWKMRFGEIDIVAENETGLHLIEVRARATEVSLDEVFPERKRQQVNRMAEAYQAFRGSKRPCTVDFLWVQGDRIEAFWNVFEA